MSLLTFCKRAASDLGLRQPEIIVGSDDLTAQILFEHACAAGEDLVAYHDWNALTVEVTVTATGSASLPALPTDFDRIIQRAQIWNVSTNQQIMGPARQSTWRELQSGFGVAGSPGYWRLLGGVLQIRPAVTSGNLITYEYISKNYCTSVSGTNQSLFMADTDTCRIPERLFRLEVIWRYRKGRGFAQYAEDLETCEREKEKAAARDRGTGRIRPVRRDELPPTPTFNGIIDG